MHAPKDGRIALLKFFGIAKAMEKYRIIGEAVGFQVGDLIDNTAGPISPTLTNGLIIGRFKRGRTDKPSVITQDNIRGELGYEPNNPDYIAVQDCLDTGVPSVQVLRVGNYAQPEG